MDMKFEQKVRERAYEIWMSAGMSDGMAHEHWVIAEQAVANETGEPAKAKATKASPAKKAAAAVTKPAVKKSAAAKISAKSMNAKPSAKASKVKH